MLLCGGRGQEVSLLCIVHVCTVMLLICGVGFGTALLGKEAAMACTVAMEDVISEHYNKLVVY